MLQSALYIVPTPIGNLNDVSRRAVEVLSAATLIAAEDTRHSRIFLNSIGVSCNNIISCHDHNEQDRVKIFAAEIAKGGIAALISDAGTPLIADPGFKVVSSLVKQGFKVIPLPGPCAAVTALSASGLPSSQFIFKGFFPVKEKELREEILKLVDLEVTAVFYESPRRVLKTVTLMKELIPGRLLVLCRELTKVFESIYYLTTDTARDFLLEDDNRLKGEFVILVGGADPDDKKDEIDDSTEAVLLELLDHAPIKLVCRAISKLTGISRNVIYQRALELKKER